MATNPTARKVLLTNIDPDILRAIKKLRKQHHTTISFLVNMAIRLGLPTLVRQLKAAEKDAAAVIAEYQLKTHAQYWHGPKLKKEDL
jgi:hypothetical protein